jgi:hypothetical protein
MKVACFLPCWACHLIFCVVFGYMFRDTNKQAMLLAHRFCML